MKLSRIKTTALRQKMIDLMLVKNFSPNTQQSYLRSVTSLANYYHQRPDRLSEEDIQQYLIYLMKDKKAAPNTCRVCWQGLQFFYRIVLGRPRSDLNIKYPSRPSKIPELLTPYEALSIVNAPENIKHQCQLKLCYACGLRTGEMVSLTVSDIDSERLQLKVVQGKGKKDRLIPLPKSMLKVLREYWRIFKPIDALFYASSARNHMGNSSIGKLYHRAKKKAGIVKEGGPHALRHAFATHQLEVGLPLHYLQRWMGHSDIRTTMNYIHWVPSYRGGSDHFIDLLGLDEP